MKEKKIKISFNEEDAQNLVNCYEKDIEYIKKLEKENEELKVRINKAIESLKHLVEQNEGLRKRINKAIEYIHSKEYQYGDLEQDVYDYDIGFDEVEKLLEMLKGEENVKN